MSIADGINGGFEITAGILLFLNCYNTFKAKEVKGVSLIPTIVFALWGYWNLYFYPSLNQWISFTGGILIVISNTLWVGQIIYYTYFRKKTLKL